MDNKPKYDKGMRVIVLSPNKKIYKGIVEGAFLDINRNRTMYTIKLGANTTKSIAVYEESVMIDKEYYKKLEEDELDYGCEDDD